MLERRDIEMIIPPPWNQKSIFVTNIFAELQGKLEMLFSKVGSSAGSVLFRIVTNVFFELPDALQMEKESFVLQKFERILFEVDSDRYHEYVSKFNTKQHQDIFQVLSEVLGSEYTRRYERVMDEMLVDVARERIRKEILVVLGHPSEILPQQQAVDSSADVNEFPWRGGFRNAVRDGKILSPVNRQAYDETGVPFVFPQRDKLVSDE